MEMSNGGEENIKLIYRPKNLFVGGKKESVLVIYLQNIASINLNTSRWKDL